VSPPAAAPANAGGAAPSGFTRRLFAWTVRPVAFVVGLAASLWRRRRGDASADSAKPARHSRREEKRRRKELIRTTAKTHHPSGRRRAA
jgi:hypothetical protein